MTDHASKITVPAGHKVVHIACPHDCPDTCSALVTVNEETGRAVKIQGDPTHPITKGYLCNKVNNYIDLVYSEKRMLYPHKRVGPKGPGARFRRISWDEALDTIAENFKTNIAKYGPESIQPFSYSGTLGMINFWGMDQRFWNKMNAARLEQTICIYAALWANLHTYGVTSGPDTEQIADAEYIIIWGANLVSTGVHMVPFIQEAKRKGATVVAIDPRRTRTTRFADWHIQPKPATDGALALGMMKVIVDAGLHDEEFLREHTLGWDEFRKDHLPQYTLEHVSEITGVPAADIEKLALGYAGTKKSHIRANYGLNRHDNAGATCRCILLLPAVTGAWRDPVGGAGFGVLDEMWLDFPYPKLQAAELGKRAESRMINMVQIGQALNDETLDPPIKSLFVYNSDVANCVGDSNLTRKGMARDDLFVVVHDTFFTDSCDYADIILPADTQLEHVDFHAAYGHYYYAISDQAIEPLGESMRNTELFRQLAKRMGYTEPELYISDEEMMKLCVDGEAHALQEGLSYEDIKEKGWARGNITADRRNRMKHGWPTTSGKIQFYVEALKEEGCNPWPSYLPEKEGLANTELTKKYPLQVLSTATHHFIGGSFQQVPRLVAMQSRPTVEINADDAQARGISDGDLCRMYNDRGETYVYAVIAPGMLPGVLGTQKQIRGSATPGGINANALNSQGVTDFGHSPIFYSVLAEIEKIAGDQVRINDKVQPDTALHVNRSI
jgi:anaerobic selenocysteine-containing dehydrogenase